MRYLLPFLAAALVASAATGQTLYDWTGPPDSPAAVASAAADGLAGDLAGNISHPVRFDLDLLRGDPALLAFPRPDGDPLWAVRTHFEDRGEGNVLWRGRVSGGPLLDSIMLTVQDGHLVGRFGEFGGPVLSLRASPDGHGHLVRPGRGGESPFLCSAAAPPIPEREDRSAAAVGPVRVVGSTVANADTDRSNAYTIDVLVLYSARAAEAHAWAGTTPAALTAAGIDYANMVFANNALNLRLRIVHRAPMPQAAGSGLFDVAGDPTVLNLRAYHEADAVVYFIDDSRTGLCGGAWTWVDGYTASDMSSYAFAYINHWCDGWGHDPLQTVAHEVGHMMGARHDLNSGNSGNWYSALYPYAFGYINTASTPPVYTLMALSRSLVQKVSYFSTVRVAPDGMTLGMAGQSENEEVLLRTRAALADYDGWLSAPAVPAAPSDLRVTELGGDAVELLWTDNANNEDGYLVNFRSGGSLVSYLLPADSESETISGLELGVKYDFRVHATLGGWRDSRQLRSKAARNGGVGPIGRPLAPSHLAAKAGSSPGDVVLTWADNSDDEAEFFVRYRCLCGGRWSESRLPADTTATTITGLKAGKNYRFQVHALNDYGETTTDKVTIKLPD